MKAKGIIKSVSRDLSGRYLVQLETDSRILVGYEDIKDGEVDITIRRPCVDAQPSDRCLRVSVLCGG